MRSILSESLLRMTESQGKTAPMSFPLRRRKPDLHAVGTTTHTTASHRFLFSNFRYYFTLFSKFFSSFPHGTCSLSVSHPYLALDGIYHPIRAAIPNNSTHGSRRRLPPSYERGSHPPWRAFPCDFTKASTICLTSPDHNSEDFQSELFPLHSPLLGES